MTTPKHVSGTIKPLDLADVIRLAILHGRGITCTKETRKNITKLTSEDQEALMSFDPEGIGCFDRLQDLVKEARAAIQPDPEPQPVAWGGKRTANVFHRSDKSVAVEMSIGCQTIEYWAFEYDRRKLSSFLSARKAAEAAQRAFLIDLPPRTTPSSAGTVSVEAAGWQPIETAPRDGTWFLACIKDAGPYKPRLVHFADAYDRFPINDEDACWSRAPTHWMPLPEPPALRALAGDEA